MHFAWITSVLRKHVKIQGIVQGVGFRPFIWRLAQELGVTGWVVNSGHGVLLEVQGTTQQLECFLGRLPVELPPLASITKCEVNDAPLVAYETAFEIRKSETGIRKQPTVPPDMAMCADCLREVHDATDRRFQYPFINCTNCGPRFTILRRLPYDRRQTTMDSFKMCGSCQAEYADPADRRFHAQPNACPICGPQVWFATTANVNSLPTVDENCQAFEALELESGTSAIERARTAYKSGLILAIKGIGGFHLACDAHNDSAIALLRERKRRPAKPFAVMVADLETAHTIASINAFEAELLASRQAPIVLLPKRIPSPIAEGIAHGNPQIGVMLVSTPLHCVLVHPGEIWVMTSGNLANEPICRTNDEARQRLSSLCDGFVFHDRPIATVCDDSVVRSNGNRGIPIRRSRGYCPLPIPIPHGANLEQLPCVLAVGSELKTAVCLTVGDQAILGQHVGDTENRETMIALERSVDHLLTLYDVRPEMIVTDAHPSYQSANWGAKQAMRWQIPHRRVQHHYAHAISLACEHGIADEPIIAVVFDGTGYGTDGAIWGGEWLIASSTDCQRFAQIAYTPLPGGDSCIERPAKSALAQLFQNSIPWNTALDSVKSFTSSELRLLQQQLQKNINCIPTSSMGRLFDAVASLLGIRQRVSFEAEAAIELEFMAAPVLQKAATNPLVYPISLVQDTRWLWDTGPLLAAIVDECLRRVDVGEMAAKFHSSVALATRRICELARDATGLHKVGLTGGVFQNVLLTELISRELESAGFTVLVHSLISPNDGGLSLGQAIIGRNLMLTSRS